MILDKEISRCEKHPEQVVSRDKGSMCRHVAVNPKKQFALRHYKLDGEVIDQQLCCDFLLLNDTQKKTCFIELKGSDVRHGIKQLEAAGNYLRSELKIFTFYYRLVTRKVNIHDIKSNEFRKFQEKHYKFFKHQNKVMTEILN